MPINYKDASAVHLSKLLDTALEKGIDITPILQKNGFSMEELSQQDVHLDFPQYLALVQDIVEHSQIPGLGLLTGKKFVTMELGIFGYVLASSENLRKALERYEKYQTISLPIPMVEIDIQPDFVSLQAKPFDLSPILHRFFMEEWAMHWNLVGARFGESPHWFSEVHFSFPQPDYVELYNEAFGCPVYFDQPIDLLRFSTRHLNTPYKIGDETIATLCEHQLDVMLQEQTQESSLTDKIRQIVVRSEGSYPSMDQIAELLHMSPRNLHRRLKGEGTSYTKILNAVRKTLAHEYLCHSEMPIKNIAVLLGYSDICNFHRAFNKWFGSTPSEYRHAAGGSNEAEEPDE